jgi:ubiquinone/menaquinone biosynthesis C-methylase UbiE
MKLDSETEFFNSLIELQYGQEDLGKMKKLASKVSWAKGWPFDNVAFWNAEAFMWSHKINKEKRELIKSELIFLKDGNNLDLGCGAYSYIQSVGFDFSAKMLHSNDNCTEKVIGDLEQELPFDNLSFDSVTLVFVLNYVDNYLGLLGEIKRVLHDKGTLMIILSQNKVNDWQKQKEVNSFPSSKWVSIIEEAGFSVNFYEKEGLWFFKCSK